MADSKEAFAALAKQTESRLGEFLSSPAPTDSGQSSDTYDKEEERAAKFGEAVGKALSKTSPLGFMDALRANKGASSLQSPLPAPSVGSGQLSYPGYVAPTATRTGQNAETALYQPKQADQPKTQVKEYTEALLARLLPIMAGSMAGGKNDGVLSLSIEKLTQSIDALAVKIEGEGSEPKEEEKKKEEDSFFAAFSSKMDSLMKFALPSVDNTVQNIARGDKGTFDAAGNAMGGAADLVEMIPGVGQVVGGVLKFGEVLAKSVGLLYSWNDSMRQADFAFAEFSASMAKVQVETEIKEMILSIERGERRAGSTERREDAFMEMKTALAPLTDSIANVTNDLLAEIFATVTDIARWLGIASGRPPTTHDVAEALVLSADAAERVGIPARFR